MVAVPPDIPLVTPVGVTVAVAGALLLHVPPVVASLNVIAALSHTLLTPVIVPAFGNGLMVIIVVAVLDVHVLVTV